MTKQTIIRLALCSTSALALASCAIEGDATGPSAERPPYTYVPAPSSGQTPPSTTAQTRTFTILHTNDEHSHLLGFTNSDYPWVPEPDGSVSDKTVATIAGKIEGEADQRTVGGLVRRQYLVNTIRESSADPVLLLSAGDVMMGTFFHAATPDAAPDYLAMTLLGYDFTTLGNHEFDWGPDTISKAIETVNETMFGGAVPIIISNLHDGDVDPENPSHAGAVALMEKVGEGDSGAPIMPWATKTLANGLKIGFVGLVGYDAALVAPAKAPLVFSVPATGAECPATACTGMEQCTLGRCVDPLDAAGHIAAMAADVQVHVNHLRDVEKVDVVVAMTHVGWNDNPLLSEITALASATDGIDIFIDGHSHSLVEPTVVASMVGSGSSIIVQAGSYGRYLGELVVKVAPGGKVTYDETASKMHEIDYRLDVDILGDTDLSVKPPHLSTELERALTLTGAVVGPVLAGLNAEFAPALGLGSILDPVVASYHDVAGETPFVDSDLLHLVTDAERLTYMGQACLDGTPVIAVQANGVIRESLRFGAPGATEPGTATAADVFRVVPLGASPFEDESIQAPGYPMVMFHLTATELLAGADVGVTNGLESDAFFLSYAGMRVEYDRTRPAFDPTDLEGSGRITKMELGDDIKGYNWVLYDVARGSFAQRWRDSSDTPIDPSATLVTMVTNLYLAGFLDAFGLTPRDGAGATITLAETALCRTGDAFDCGAGEAPIAPCISKAAPQWTDADVDGELKEWGALLGYLGSFPGAPPEIPDGMYDSSVAFSSRVIDATPAP